MKLVEIFAEMAGKAEKKLGNLAQRQEGNLRRREALKRIEDQYEQMAADGVIDTDELASLKSQLKAQGLSTSALENLFDQLQGTDAAVRGEDGSKFQEAFSDMLGDEIDATYDQQSDLNFAIQMNTADASNYTYAASQLSKKEHDLYSKIIANMKA